MSVNDASGIVIDDSRVKLQIVASLTDNSRGVIYNCNMFIVQASEYFFSFGGSWVICIYVISLKIQENFLELILNPDGII